MLGLLCFLVFGSALGQITDDFSCTYQVSYPSIDAFLEVEASEPLLRLRHCMFQQRTRCSMPSDVSRNNYRSRISRIWKFAPRIDCNTVTLAMCQSSVWRQVLTEDCPTVCGFCPTKPYVVEDPCMTYSPDAVPNCQAWALVGFCTSPSYTVAQKKQYCSTTCKLC
ncbi:hypothetical protein CAEBREN_25653 [Caenorhabditis brenneri]|uniref:ShKT domain-containing protein n=1 Tax=Caenorhabditis brenneri TaxID=135651 RepID=G0NN61_CAEBE|nr:hypothetical protein CAEBREN_25653 [Caenorhabditis brenneri]